MGLTYQVFARLPLVFGWHDLRGVSMLELGNQTFAMTDDEKAKVGVTDVVCKPHFERLGVKHVSLDLTGKDRSLALDLTRPIPPASIGGPFEVVTDFGTSEHVDDQYACYRNIHNLCRVGGLMIHELPHIGYWLGHCRFYYDYDFFLALAHLNGYVVRWLERITYPQEGDAVFAVLRKEAQVEFCNVKQFAPLVFESARQVTAREYWKAPYVRLAGGPA